MSDFEFEFVPGMMERGNIDVYDRPVVQNPDNSISTLRSASFGFDGRHYLLPLIGNDGGELTPDQAVALFRETNRHLGSFDSPEAANDYAKRISVESGRWYRGVGEGNATGKSRRTSR